MKKCINNNRCNRKKDRDKMLIMKNKHSQVKFQQLEFLNNKKGRCHQ